MTALTTVPAPAVTQRPAVPWTRLAWVTWRQHRAALAGAAALLAGLSLYMLVEGLRIRAAVHSLGLDSCRPPSAARCATQLGIFQNAYFGTAQTLSGVLQVVPVLIGVFAGGPLLAGELEIGTFRFAWTQGCGRVRWAVSKLALLAVVLTAATAAFSLLFSWFYQPFFTLGFDGVLAPQLVRHGEQVIPARSFIISQWLTYPGGKPVSNGVANALIVQARAANRNPIAWLAQHHIGQDVAYQPESRFWHFQFIEGGWLLVLALLLGAATVWLVRRRAA
jgi:hypothetical protein